MMTRRLAGCALVCCFLVIQANRAIAFETPRQEKANDSLTTDLRAQAVHAVIGLSDSVLLLIVPDESGENGTALATLLASKGMRARAVQSKSTANINELVVATRILSRAATIVEVEVTVSGQTPSANLRPGHAYFSQHLVTVRQARGTWKVVKVVEKWAG